jgi:uncharacterized damage-inducible protein DinB
MLLPEFDQEKSFSFMEMANHLARLPGWGAATLETDSMDLDQFVPPPPAGTQEGVLASFDQNVSGFRRALEEASDEELMKPWTLLQGGRELFTMPRMTVLRLMILNHIVHHRGQFTVYLRLNDLPVPALYGPSADEGGM